MAKRKGVNAQGNNEISDAEVASPKRTRVDDDLMEEESEEQKEFEAKYAEKVRALIDAKAKVHGRIAELGIIQSLEMHQFMCHPRLSFIFGPQINFIIGHNGSGKSAVLSAITIALGGKAITTGRGTGLRSFIREGQSGSEVTVTLKNEGNDAYKPHIYGKSIVITRRFTKDGSSSYKIKSKDGRTISTKREELSAICDHMNIQVDNPMNVLSQDAARQFLSASHPSDKYEFFLKGTQLKQLSDEYEACLENIGKTYKILEAKKSILPDLKKAVTDAQARYKGAKRALETKVRIGDLKHELAWSHVREKEKEMSQKIEDTAKVARKVTSAHQALEKAEKHQNIVNQGLVELEDQLCELGDFERLNAKKDKIDKEFKANKATIQSYLGEINKMNQDIKRANNAIEQFKRSIETEAGKLREDKQKEREDRQRRLEESKKAVDDYGKQLEEANDKIRDLQARQETLKAHIAEKEKRKEAAQEEMVLCGNQVDLLTQQQYNSISIFGNNLPDIPRRINSMNWHGKKPVGPLGRFVSLRDQRWADLMRIHLGGLMTSFAVTDGRDRNALKQLLHQSNNPTMQIVVAEEDLFDYSHGEPPEHVLTLLRALKINDEYVKRIFINQLRIEKTCLAETRAEAERIGEEIGGGHALSLDYYRVNVYSDGGYYSMPMQQLDYRDSRMKLFAHENPEEAKRHWKERGQKADGTLQEAIKGLAKYQAEMCEIRKEMAVQNSDARRLSEEHFKLKQAYRALQNEHNEDVPVNISALEDALREQEVSLESTGVQLQNAMEQKKEIDYKQIPLLQELNQIKAQCDEFGEKRGKLTTEIMKVTDEHTEAKNSVDYYRDKYEGEQRKVKEFEKQAQLLQEEYESWTKAAEEFCDGKRVENPRRAAEVERQLHSVEQALREQEKANGATIEELEQNLNEAIQKYKNTEKDLKDMSNLNKVLKASVVNRLNQWHNFRRHIALRTKLQFQYHLSNRAYFGKVLFDHDRQRLELKVQTDDQAATQGLNKDSKSLSGGEKSFSTICLLLALWEAIGCPIRCLDEFDVFMDAVNRRISMKMMIETANASDSKQYILITPQDMSNVTFGPSVRVHRMGDPERGQSTLAL